MANPDSVTTSSEIPSYLPGGSESACAANYQNDPLGFQLEGYRTHGPLYRTFIRNRYWYALSGPDANNFIWQNPHLWSYAKANESFLEEMGHDHVTGLDGDHHKQKRAILKPAFTMSAAMRFLPIFHRVFAQEIAAVAEAGEPIDLVAFWAELITIANAESVAQADIPRDVLKRMARWEVQFLRGLFLDDSKVSFYEREEYRELKEETMSWLRTVVDSRLEAPSDIEDNFTDVLRQRMEIEGPKPSRDNLVNDLYFILIAGADNTSALIDYALMQLYSEPSWLAWLREELADWDGANVMAIQEMTRLKAVIMETQRIRPGALQLYKHAKEGFTYEGITVPVDSDVIHFNNMGHFLEEFYPDPMNFDPGRFVEKQRFVPKTFGFFGGGSHTCLGRNHSLMQTPIALATLLKDYELSFAEPINLHLTASYSGGRIEKPWMATVSKR